MKKVVQIADFPEFRQVSYYDCGATAIESVLAYFGFDVPEKEIIQISGTRPKRGTPIKGIQKIAEKFGLKFKSGEMTISELKKNIRDGKPAIIAIQSSWRCRKAKNLGRCWSRGHYVIPVGYDDKRIYFADPYCFVRTYLNFDELEERWHDSDGKNKYLHWGITFYGKKIKYSLDKAIHMDHASYIPSKSKYKTHTTYKRFRIMK